MPPQTYISLLDHYPKEILDDFVRRYVIITHQVNLRDRLKLADTIAMAQQTNTKKGNMIYTRWRRNIIDTIDDLNKELHVENLTVFERLHRAKKTNSTVFDKLKRSKNT